MMDWSLWIHGLLNIMVLAIAGWLISLFRKNVTIVDSLWSLFFLIGFWSYLPAGIHSLMDNPRAALVMILALIWGIRLSAYLSWRNTGKKEDHRYATIRNNNPPFWIRSLYIVFLLQGVLAGFISAPLFSITQMPGNLSFIDGVAACLWLTGFIFETVGDWQLARFKAKPGNAGRVMRSGLWSLTRHPNYFGEACIWWAYYLFACAAGGWWTLPAPLLMNWLLIKVSGVAMMEKDIAQRRPDYLDYIRNTPSFLPFGKILG